MTYLLMPDGSVIDTQGNQHPPDPANSGYAAFLAWRADGGEPQVAAPLPDPLARRVHPYYFRLRFSQPQRVAIATSADPLVIDLRESFAAADTIGLDDPRTAAGLQLLVAKGLIEQTDVAKLLVDRTPQEKP